MAVLSAILRRFGYVRLADYGLALGPGGTVISMQKSAADWQLDAGADTLPAFGLAASVAPAEAPPAPSALPDAVSTDVQQLDSQPGDEAGAIAASRARPPVPSAEAAAGADDETEDQVDDEAEDDEWQWKLARARARAVAEEAERLEATPPAASPRPTDATPPREASLAEPPASESIHDADDDEPTRHRLELNVDRAAREAEDLEDAPTSAYRPAPPVGARALPLPAQPPHQAQAAAPRRRLARGSSSLPAAEAPSHQAAARALAAARSSVSGTARGRRAPLPRLPAQLRPPGVPDSSG
jgi:hypothetical protein